MNVTLRQLRAFLALARTGSFTLAAQSLYITQSALSGLIKELEQGVGARLVDRSTRRVHLTAIGERLHPLLDAALSDLDGALRQAIELREMKTGLVRVAVSQLLASTLMPDLIADFQAQHPLIQVRLVDTPVEAVMACVFSGEVELGIGPEREPNSDIRSSPLFEGAFTLVLPPGHELVGRRCVRWNDLAGLPLITLRGQFTERLRQDLRVVAPALSFAPASEVAFMSTALSMVKAGLGLGLCIPYAAGLIELYGLQMRRLNGPVVYRSFEVFSRRGRTLSPAAQRFLDFIGPRLRGLPHLR
jgi:DNA-binding transcriptional LysR family regulator